ncbi:protein SCARECROW-like [Eucalyptus grandis]|uniref:protein SCARECROW-like n=1 Tax=Eucalyptus grandis TaxID=71139 RepID=UPI00192E8532|nr:protein SCARECROW-like [Eucalyptus grandis]
MLKEGFEVVNRDLEMTPSLELWDSSGFSDPASARCAGSERNELSDWVEQVTRQLIDDLPETPGGGADSEMASEDCIPSILNDLRPRKALRWNVIHHHLEGNSDSVHWGNEASPSESNGLGLLTLLLECAVAISVDNLGEAHRMLLELTQMASPYGPSCAERIVAYFAKAMSSRVINSWLGICLPLVDYRSVNSAFQVFNTVSPFVKFAHFTSNQAILEAFHRRDRVHIVDLDIMQGLQWPALFHILATRIEGPPHVRLTGMGASMELLVETGRQLTNFAKRLGMSFEFHPVVRKSGEIADLPYAVQLRQGETLAVHWLQHSLYDATGPDWKTMRLLEELAPRVITLVEQDVLHGGSFLDRFVGSLHYYSTLFDSLGACLPSDDPSRHQVEHGLLHREINNILAIGGPGRSGEDKFRSWRSELLGRSGSFMQVPMSANSMAQAQLILNMFPPVQGYSLVQGDGTLRLGWKDTSLYTASAWTSIAHHHR